MLSGRGDRVSGARADGNTAGSIGSIAMVARRTSGRLGRRIHSLPRSPSMTSYRLRRRTRRRSPPTPQRESPGLGEQFFDSATKPGDDITAVQRVGLAERYGRRTRANHAHRPAGGIDDPDQRRARGAIVVELFLEVRRRLAARANLDREIRRARDKSIIDRFPPRLM